MRTLGAAVGTGEATQLATGASVLDADGSYDGLAWGDDGAAHRDCTRAGRASGDGAQAPNLTRDGDARWVATGRRCERERRRREAPRCEAREGRTAKRGEPILAEARTGSRWKRKRCHQAATFKTGMPS